MLGLVLVGVWGMGKQHTRAHCPPTRSGSASRPHRDVWVGYGPRVSFANFLEKIFFNIFGPLAADFSY